MATKPQPRKKATRAQGSAEGTPQTYTVQSGDTLYAIAMRLGTTVEALMKENNTSNPNLISVGQVLAIPTAGSLPAVDSGLTLIPTTDALHMRAKPVVTAPIVSVVLKSQSLTALGSPNEIVKKVGNTNQWIMVRDPSGAEGYVAAQYVRIKEDSAPPFSVEQQSVQTGGSGSAAVGNISAESSRRAAGIDISQWDEKIDWLKVYATGKRFVFMKITEGESYTDPTFKDNWIGAKSAGILRGAYHFFRCSVDAKKQADYFINQIKTMNDDGELPPVLDIENNDGRKKEEIIPAVKIWLEAVESAFGKTPILFSGHNFLHDYLTESDGKPPEWVNKYPLWLATYPNQYHENLQPLLPPGWSAWKFWQYSEKGKIDGISSTVDLNVFNGSLEDLLSFAGKSGPSEKDPISYALNDRPVGEEGQRRLNFALNDKTDGPDRLDYDNYAEAFAQILSGQYTQTPLTVGIYASWGMGKSFLLGKIEDRLQKRQNDTLQFAFVKFNAWVYSGSENLWAGMVTSLYNGIEDHYKSEKAKHVRSYSRQEALSQIWRTIKKSFSLLLIFGVPALIISYLLDYQQILTNWRELTDTVLLILGGAPLLAKIPDLVKAAKALLDSAVLLRSQELANLSSRKDFRDKIGFMADIQSELRRISDMIIKLDRKSGQKTRFVIVVDDLDRCPPEKAVEVLEGIALLLSDRTDDPFIIFLAMDARVLVKAVEMRYGGILAESGISGYEFLDKIVQIPFRIPPAPDSAIEGYVKSLLYQSPEAEEKTKGRAFIDAYLKSPSYQSADEEGKAKRRRIIEGYLQSPSYRLAEDKKKAERSAMIERDVESLLYSSAKTEKRLEPRARSGGKAVDETAQIKEEALPVQPPIPLERGEEEQVKVEAIKEDEPFSDDEQKAFESFSKFLSRNPRRVKRIVNIYRLARILLTGHIPVQVAIKWIILTEQWPFRVAWMMQKIEDDSQHEKATIQNDSPIVEIYEKVRASVGAEQSRHLAMLDEDSEIFDKFIKQEPFITAEDIKNLRPVTFNLNPAMQNEVLKSVLQVNDEKSKEAMAK